MGKLIIRLIIILSISINIAFAIHLFTSIHAGSKAKSLELNLTELQKSQIKKNRLKSHQENELLKKKIAECQERMIAILQSETVDKEKTNHCIEEISSIQKEIQRNTIEEIIQIKKYLNPHQCNCLVQGISAQMKQSSKPCTMECCNPKQKGGNQNE